MIGENINGYKIIDKIGEGGMGVVYLAQNSAGIRVAIKTLKPEFSKDSKMLERFRTECLSMKRFEGHPNIIQIRDITNFNGLPILMMEYLDGGMNLNTYIEKNGAVKDYIQLKKWMEQTLEALDYAHTLSPKIIHRDVKPSNLYLTKFNVLKLLDFGIVKVLEDSSDPNLTSKIMTSTTSRIGSINFMSPEQSFDSKLVNECSDIYSFGRTFKVLMTAGDPRVAISAEPFKTIIEKSTMENPNHRYQSCREILKVLDSNPKSSTKTATIVETAAPKASAKTNDAFSVNGVAIDMVLVEGGIFMMGSTDGYSNEKPVHSVTISSYYIGKYPVTQALWKAVMNGNNPSYFKGDTRPADSVNYNDCQTFIQKLNTLTGKKYRFPTEAEWEYAARGGNKSKGYKYSGSNVLKKVGWYDKNSGGDKHLVDERGKAPNELGIYGMSGNVWEWCYDWCASYSSGKQTNPTGSSTGTFRVCRGGGYYCSASGCTVTFRNCYSPGYSDFNLGLRLALVP